MKCKKCGANIPDDHVACPACTMAKSRQAYLEYQKHYLPRVIEGKAVLRITRQGDRPWHLVLVGDPYHAYCGEPVSPAWSQRREHLDELPTKVCALCRDVFTRLKEEVTDAEVPADIGKNPAE